MIGLALLVAGLAINRAWRPFDDEQLAKSELGRAADGLLSTLSLFFVPAGVGVVQYMGLLQAQGAALAASLVVSTLLTPGRDRRRLRPDQAPGPSERRSVTPFRLWVYLQTTPLFWLTATLAA